MPEEFCTCHAALQEDAVLAEHCLKRGNDPDAVDSEGYTALALAAKQSALECVRLLLEAGADPIFQSNAFHCDSPAPLIHAIAAGCPKVRWHPHGSMAAHVLEMVKKARSRKVDAHVVSGALSGPHMHESEYQGNL